MEDTQVQVRMMSTKVPYDKYTNANPYFEPESDFDGEESCSDPRQELDTLMRELENKQRHLIRTQYLQQAVEDKKLLQKTTGGIKSQIEDAVANLTMLTKECQNDLVAIDLENKAVNQELRKRSSQVYQQESEK